MRTITRRIDIPVSTLLKVAAVAAGLWALYLLSPYILLSFVSVLLAVTLEPVVKWLQHRGWKRGLAVGAVAVVLLGLFALFVGVVIPVIARQIADVAEDLPRHTAKLQHWAKDSPMLSRVIGELRQWPRQEHLTRQLESPEPWKLLAEAVVAGPVLLILALYLLADGPRVYAWLLAYVPRDKRLKVGRTADGMAKVVYAYVRGQLITSVLVALFSLITLSLLHVKAALALAVLAGIFDIIPLVGFIAFTLPAVLMALLVSPTAALTVLVLYTAYHFVENYVIVPRVYGKELRLSTLTVILALGAAGALVGIVGAVLVLPLVAALPIIERHWLRDRLGDELIEDHAELERAADHKDPDAIRRVIEGEQHRPPDERH